MAEEGLFGDKHLNDWDISFGAKMNIFPERNYPVASSVP